MSVEWRDCTIPLVIYETKSGNLLSLGGFAFVSLFSCHSDKCLIEINLRKEGFVLVPKLEGVAHLSRQGMRQGYEEAGHIVSTIRKLGRAEMQPPTHSLFLFCLVWDSQLMEWYHPDSGWVFPPLQLNLSGTDICPDLSPRSNCQLRLTLT